MEFYETPTNTFNVVVGCGEYHNVLFIMYNANSIRATHSVYGCKNVRMPPHVKPNVTNPMKQQSFEYLGILFVAT